jgi:hypothetical protein
VPQLDLLNDFGEGAFFRKEIDLHRSRLGFRSRSWFFPALKTRTVTSEWLRAPGFGAPRGWGLRRLVVSGRSSISLWPPGPVIGRTRTPGAVIPAVPSPGMVAVLGIGCQAPIPSTNRALNVDQAKGAGPSWSG